MIDPNPTLPAAMEAEWLRLEAPGLGRVHAYRAGPASGTPLLLVMVDPEN